MDNNQTNVQATEKKKSNVALIIFIIIVLLLLLFAVWFFFIKDDGKKENTGNNGTNPEETTKPTKTTTPAKEKYEYTYVDGKLTQIVDEDGNPKQTDFIIDGIILVGNRHSYAGLDAESEGIMTKLVSQGYKKDGINSSFYLNEWIEFYIDTEYTGSASDVKIIIAPHKTVEELEKMSLTELEEFASDNGGYIIDYVTPDEENYKYVGNGYVNMDYLEGKYDVLFTYKGKLAYFIEVSLTKEEE